MPMTNQATATREIDGYRIAVSRYVPKPIWFCTVVRLSDMVRFPLWSRSYSTSDDAFAVGESFVRNVVANAAEFARIEKANATYAAMHNPPESLKRDPEPK